MEFNIVILMVCFKNVDFFSKSHNYYFKFEASIIIDYMYIELLHYEYKGNNLLYLPLKTNLKHFQQSFRRKNSRIQRFNRKGQSFPVWNFILQACLQVSI